MLLVRPWVGKIYDRKGPSAVIYPSFIFFAIGMMIVGARVQPMDYVVVCGIYRNWLRFIISMFTNPSDSICRKQRMGHAISTFYPV